MHELVTAFGLALGLIQGLVRVYSGFGATFFLPSGDQTAKDPSRSAVTAYLCEIIDVKTSMFTDKDPLQVLLFY